MNRVTMKWGQILISFQKVLADFSSVHWIAKLLIAGRGELEHVGSLDSTVHKLVDDALDEKYAFGNSEWAIDADSQWLTVNLLSFL